ncbi:L,D-transpeptidase family protein [Paracoccus sp. MBLB3053]|uniref:L,D-transpeptidase family protein n=1 Tax=Paracoccus aurantius TaxID=3073814 RepID=A0ABU2HT98_9RHOB|nr:L,D-transpeptidase family protein [Paracoccus sp. MBLB3053]MDS9468269.1 L,D-transpeptidase family protein [Paracoccus sp. MBLB3053]
MALIIQGGTATAQGLETASVAALPAPRLVFSEREMQLAQAVARNPGLADFYGTNGLKPIFLDAEGAGRRDALIKAIGQAAGHGLPATRYDRTKLVRLHEHGADTIDEELAFAVAFFRWTHDLTGGLLDPQKVDPAIKRTVNRPRAGEMMRDFAKAADPVAWLAGIAPSGKDYRSLQQALAATERLIAPAGTPQVPRGTLKEGDSGEAVALLRVRLESMGFAAVPLGSETEFDGPLTSALGRFQTEAGLVADGVAGPRTISRLNQGPGPIAWDLLVALERLRWMQGYDLDARHVWVNLPSFTASINEAGREVFSTRVVIGKDEDTHETPEFTESMKYIVVNPRWNVPRSITVKEYLPRLQANRHAVGHLDVVDRAGNVISRDRIDFRKYTAANFPYRMRQKPSDDNALGVVKFMFPNPWNIYLHDTPTKHLFNQSRRAYSHGCIRVARPLDLAYELLVDQVRHPEQVFNKALNSGRETYLNMRTDIPVHLVYFTTFPDASGKIRRYADIYGRDARVRAALVKAGVGSLDSAASEN